MPTTVTDPAGLVGASTMTNTVTDAPVVLFHARVSPAPVPPVFVPATQVREPHAAVLVAKFTDTSSPLTGVAVTVRLRLFGTTYDTTKSGPVDGVKHPVPAPS